MKFCVISSLRLETPAKRDKLNEDVKLWIFGKKVWGKTISSSGQDEEGHPSHSLIIRFDDKADMDELFSFIKERMAKIPVLKGTVSKHNCTHDEIPRPCVIEEEYSK